MLDQMTDALSQQASRAGSHWILLLQFMAPVFLGAICIFEIKGKKKWFFAVIAFFLAGYVTSLFIDYALPLFIINGILFWITLFSFMRDRKLQNKN